MFSELTTGFLMDYVKSLPKIYIFIFFTGLATLANVQVAFAFSYWSLVLFTLVFGLIFGGLKGTIILLALEFLGEGNVMSGFGVYTCSLSLIQMAGPPAAGLYRFVSGGGRGDKSSR